MQKYIVKPDMSNFDYPLFVWYLIYSNMSQHFSSILDIMSPYLPWPSKDNESQISSKPKEKDRVYNFIYRVTFGYVSEAQKTIKEFFKTPEYIELKELVGKEHLEEFETVENQWKEKNNDEEYKYLSTLRNTVFHFASEPNDIDEYKDRFEKYVNEISLNKSLSMPVVEYADEGREYRYDTFCDTLWDINITQGYNKIKNCKSPEDKDYQRDVIERLMKSVDLCYKHVFLVRDFLEQYFIHKGLIIENE